MSHRFIARISCVLPGITRQGRSQDTWTNHRGHRDDHIGFDGSVLLDAGCVQKIDGFGRDGRMPNNWGYVKIMNMKKTGYLILWEMILIFSSILMFRGVWILLDQIQWMSRPTGLWASMIVGSLAGIAALWAINHQGRGKK